MRVNIMSSFNKDLSNILSEDNLAIDTPVPDNPMTQLRQKAQELKDAKDQVAQLEQEYVQAIDALNGQLAVGVKKCNPRLSANLRNGVCNIGYRSKSLNFKPNLDTQTWAAESSDPTFARRFSRNHGPATALNPDIDALAKAIISFFTNHYKTL